MPIYVLPPYTWALVNYILDLFGSTWDQSGIIGINEFNSYRQTSPSLTVGDPYLSVSN